MALAMAGMLSACGSGEDVASGDHVLIEQSSVLDASEVLGETATSTSATVTFKLEGLSALPADLRLNKLALRGMTLHFTPVEEGEEVSLDLEDLLFDVQGGEDEITLSGFIPAPGRYQVRMQTRSEPFAGEGASSTDGEEERGLSFSGWMDPSVENPFDVRAFSDSRGDGPNPHPFDGGDGTGKPSQPGGDDDPVASGEPVSEERGDGPNPHPFDGGDGTGKPSQPGGDDDPVASNDRSDGPNPHPFDEGDDEGDDPVRPPGSEAAEHDASWTALSYQDDGSTSLEMGTLHVHEGDSAISLSIFLPAIEASPSQLETAPSMGSFSTFTWDFQGVGSFESTTNQHEGYEGQSIDHLGMQAFQFIAHGRIY